MRVLFAIAMTTLLSACAVARSDAPNLTASYPVAYDALGACVHANAGWGGGYGPRLLNDPSLKETRIEAQGGFDTTLILVFRAAGEKQTTFELRAASGADRQAARFQPVIDSCVARLTA